MFLDVRIVRLLMVASYIALVVYIILVMFSMTILLRTTQSVVVNTDCTRYVCQIDLGFPPLFYVTNLNSDLFDLINKITRS